MTMKLPSQVHDPANSAIDPTQQSLDQQQLHLQQQWQSLAHAQESLAHAQVRAITALPRNPLPHILQISIVLFTC